MSDDDEVSMGSPDLALLDPAALPGVRWAAVMTDHGVPWQFQGQLADGRWLYFRARGPRAQLGLGETFREAVEDTVAELGGACLTRWLTDDEAADAYAAAGMDRTQIVGVFADMLTDLPGVSQHLAESDGS